ncbi:ankyrin [Daldinia sp. FL1419]|nr:ankyrin [Daldinia sp. FL1419]
MAVFLQLPNELLDLVTQHLDLKDIANACRCSHSFYHAFDPILYRRIGNNIDVLFWAIKLGRARVVEKLLVAGLNPNQVEVEYASADDGNPVNHAGRRSRPGHLISRTWTPLHLAARLGRDDIIELLLDHGANVNALSRGFCLCRDASDSGYGRGLHTETGSVLPWWMPLHTAICHKNYSTARILATRGASFQVTMRTEGPPSNYITALHMTSYAGDILFSQFILDHYKPAIDIQDHHGMSPLHWAYRAYKWDMITWLVQHGANINTEDSNGCTLLIDACARGRFHDALKLLDLGAHPYGYGTRPSPLHCCSEARVSMGEDAGTQLLLAKRLIEAGADLDARTHDLATPLILAAVECSVTIAEYLIDSGAVVDARDNLGMTPLMGACKCSGNQNNLFPTIRLLLQRGASTTAVDDSGRTAFEIFCNSVEKHPDVLAIVQLLLEFGSPSNATSNPTASLIRPLFRNGHLEICEYLQCLNTRLPSGEILASMVDEAVAKNDTASLQYLLQFKGTTELLTTQERLFKALESKKYKVAKIILDVGAPWTHVSEFGWSCLLHACQAEDTTLARMLLEKGADPNHSNEEGQTPLDIALERGNPAMCELLLDYGAKPFPEFVNRSTGRPHAGAVFQAVLNGSTQLLEVMIKRDLFRLAPAAEQIRTMHHVCSQKESSWSNELLDVLLRGGADPNMPLMRPLTFEYCLPLQVAMLEANNGAVDLLLKYGATPLR